jgi:hypothetical protein
MPKITTSGYDLLKPNEYVLEVTAAKPIVGEYGPQLRLDLVVVGGDADGMTMVDYCGRGEDGSIKDGSKAWTIFEACLGRQLTPNEALDTDDLVGKRFQARVAVRSSGNGNRVEHGTVGPAGGMGGQAWEDISFDV